MPMRLVESLPRKYKNLQSLASWIWLLIFPLSLLLAIFHIWWDGLVGLFIGWQGYFFLRRMTVHSVLEYAEDDEAFFDELAQRGFIVFRDRSGKLME